MKSKAGAKSARDAANERALQTANVGAHEIELYIRALRCDASSRFDPLDYPFSGVKAANETDTSSRPHIRVALNERCEPDWIGDNPDPFRGKLIAIGALASQVAARAQ